MEHLSFKYTVSYAPSMLAFWKVECDAQHLKSLSEILQWLDYKSTYEI